MQGHATPSAQTDLRARNHAVLVRLRYLRIQLSLPVFCYLCIISYAFARAYAHTRFRLRLRLRCPSLEPPISDLLSYHSSYHGSRVNAQRGDVPSTATNPILV